MVRYVSSSCNEPTTTAPRLRKSLLQIILKIGGQQAEGLTILPFFRAAPLAYALKPSACATAPKAFKEGMFINLVIPDPTENN